MNYIIVIFSYILLCPITGRKTPCSRYRCQQQNRFSFFLSFFFSFTCNEVGNKSWKTEPKCVWEVHYIRLYSVRIREHAFLHVSPSSMVRNRIYKTYNFYREIHSQQQSCFSMSLVLKKLLDFSKHSQSFSPREAIISQMKIIGVQCVVKCLRMRSARRVDFVKISYGEKQKKKKNAIFFGY